VPARNPPHAADPLTANVACEQRTEPVPPQPDRLGDLDPALVQKFLHVAQDSGKRTYISTTSRITSADELERRNGLGGNALDFRLIRDRYQPLASPATLV
jgi:hypothetical protein